MPATNNTRRGVAIMGAPSNIGIRPYDDGTLRGLDRTPRALRAHGVVERLRATDTGDVRPPQYEDFVRPSGGVRNERAVAAYSAALAEHLLRARGHDRFVVMLGGDCSIVLGAMLAVRQLTPHPVGLAYVDAHADFATPQESATGSAASMCLAMVAGRGDTPLARLGGSLPLVQPRHIALIGRRDDGEPYGQHALAELGVLDLTGAHIRTHGITATCSRALDRMGSSEIGGFWIHVDADVLDASIMQAVDSPTPFGPGVNELVELVTPLVRHPGAFGMHLSIYDPLLDESGACAERLVEFLERTLEGA